MKKLLAVILTLALLSFTLLSLSSCGDAISRMSDRELFLSAGQALAAFGREIYTTGTGITDKDLSALTDAPALAQSLSLRVAQLEVAGSDVLSDNPLSLDFKLNTGKKDIGGEATLSLFEDSLSAAFQLTEQGAFLSLPKLYEKTIQFPAIGGTPGKADLSALVTSLGSQLLQDERLHREVLDYTYEDISVKNATRLTLDLSDVNFSEIVLSLLPQLRAVSDTEQYGELLDALEQNCRNNEYRPDDCRLLFWFSGSNLIGGSAVLTEGQMHLCADFTMNRDGGRYEFAGRVMTGTSETDERQLLSLDFDQTLSDGKKNGRLDITLTPPKSVPEDLTAATQPLAAELTDGYDGTPESDGIYDTYMPEKLFLKTTFNTTVEGNRQNSDIIVNAGYELYGLSTSFNLPLHLLTDYKDSTLSALWSVSGSFLNTVTVKAQLQTTTKALDSYTAEIPAPDQIFNFETDDTTELGKKLSDAFTEQCPALAELFIGKTTEPVTDAPESVLSVSCESDPRSYHVYVGTNGEDGTRTGTGEYMCDCTFTCSGDVYTVTETGSSQSYTVNKADQNFTSYPFTDDSLTLIDRDGNSWMFNDADAPSGAGYVMRQFAYEAILPDGKSGTLTVTLTDGSRLFDKASFTDEEIAFLIEGIRYDVSYPWSYE